MPSKVLVTPMFMLPFNLFLILLLLLLLLPFCLKSASSFPHKIPRLSLYDHDHKEALMNLRTRPDGIFSDEYANISKDFQTYYYDQTLDHFNYGPESYATFKQRYVINLKHWGGSNSSSPILAYFGAEASLDDELTIVGFINDVAPDFKALAVYMEHRFYGNSIPFGLTLKEALKNETLRGYFNSAQAIADYAEVLLHVKENFYAHNSPIIVVGGSYGGMLASWFRLKYPHIALGALASSAPVLYFDDITPQNGYYSIVTKDFQEVSETCFETIRESWAEIERVASTPNGLSSLTQQFKTCSELSNYYELQFFLKLMYARAAQYNHPPSYPVTMICGGIDGAPNGTSILGRIFAGVVSYKGNQACYNTSSAISTETIMGWRWQICSEMVIPIGIDNGTMFPPSPFNLTRYIQLCKLRFGGIGVLPRPHWVTTYYGGHDIKLVLQRFGSNIIFSNGLRDPYSSGGVLEDISQSIVAVSTRNGSHCLDLHSGNNTDPEWLVLQRKTEVKIMEGWLETYYADMVQAILTKERCLTAIGDRPADVTDDKKWNEKGTQGIVASTSGSGKILFSEAATVAEGRHRFCDAWIMDSGVTWHMTSRREWFGQYEPVSGGSVFMGNDHALEISGVGTIKIKMVQNSYREKNHEDCERCACGMKGEKVAANLYVLLGETHKEAKLVVASIGSGEESTVLWHRKLGPMSERGMKILSEQKLLSGLTKFTTAYTPQQNGVAERMNRTLLDRIKAMLSTAGLPKSFWAESVKTASYIINRSPSVAIDLKTPMEVWIGKPTVILDYIHLEVRVGTRRIERIGRSKSLEKKAMASRSLYGVRVKEEERGENDGE
ncbi:uncharacterized protein [Henckelia pumila]|uniref:uncharacterized protein n=1 Tax=Henckelia pumila TaxID=405737 RepID=UPI003C6DEF66